MWTDLNQNVQFCFFFYLFMKQVRFSLISIVFVCSVCQIPVYTFPVKSTFVDRPVHRCAFRWFSRYALFVVWGMVCSFIYFVFSCFFFFSFLGVVFFFFLPFSPILQVAFGNGVWTTLVPGYMELKDEQKITSRSDIEKWFRNGLSGWTLMTIFHIRTGGKNEKVYFG